MRRLLVRVLLLLTALNTLTTLIALLMRWHLVGRLLGLGSPRHRVRVESGLWVPTRDGIVLATDHYFPVRRGQYPTILIRSPYGRREEAGAFGVFLSFFARRFAERGYHVVVQDTRGRFDSGGVFEPYFHEKADGLDTIRWLEGQPWFNGVIGLWGPSYLGIVQWAIAAESPAIRAMVPAVTSSRLQSIVYPDGALDLGLTMRWMKIFQALDQVRGRPLVAAVPLLWEIEQSIAPAFEALPVAEADQAALGEPVPFYREWLRNSGPDSALWRQMAADARTEAVTAPVHLIGGWYDFFLRGLLEDYAALRAAGRRPYLTIGPWSHFTPTNPMVMFDALREGIAWFDAHLKGAPARLRAKPVRILIMGADEWRDLDDWPPPAVETAYYLHSSGLLGQRAPDADDPPDHYVYDPADPTPAVGGAQFSLGAGPRDNSALEARPDVLTYTTPPLRAPVEVIGPVRLALYVRSSLDHTDFFGRLCDLHPDGRSVNVCDGLFRLSPGMGEPGPDGARRILIDMWATAYRFKPGHCIRLQVSSGAHPHWNRNLGTGDLLGSEMRVAAQTVYHDAARPSALLLPCPA